MGKRKNRGLELLLANKHSNLPVVCLSQEFKTNFNLVSTVYERGALPIQKEYNELGYQMIYGGIRYLTRERRGGGSKVEVFVSHAHKDKDLARKLVKAIEKGLHVPSDAIRCTSVDGHGFVPGTDYFEALKDELAGASCVVGLWTPQSMKSQWCLFELGAAWGLARKALFRSLGASALRDPPAGFRSIVSSRLIDTVQLGQFLAALARITGWPAKDHDHAQAALEQLANLAKRKTHRDV